MSTAAGGPRSEECTARIGCMPAIGRVACKSRDTADAAFRHSAVSVLYTCRVKTCHIPTPRTHMASAPSRVEAALGRWIPAPIRRKLRGKTGRRFARFVLVAVAAVVSSQLALVIFLDAGNMTAGISGVLAAIVGAAVSYVLSRWAWERKGRPHVLKETLPFWIVSVAAWIVLGLATKLGVHWADSMPRGSLQWHLVVNGTYFAANVLTFFARFLIFHYVLFADRGSSGGAAGGVEPTPHSAAEGFAETLEESPGDGNSAAATTRPSSA